MMRLATDKGGRIAHVLIVCAILLGALGVAAAPVSATDGPCEVGLYTGGQYLICVPPDGAWNGDLVVYAHGYVAPENPLVVPEDQLVLPDGTSIPETIMGLGYAFAATSYRTNGLAIEHGVTDLVDLVTLFETKAGPAGYVYLVGASEGGLNTALSVERAPDVFDGGAAACGPVGDFRRQVNYWGDVRVLFDYFFPGILPPFTPEEPLIPPELIQNWYWCGDPDRNVHYPCTPDPAMAYELRVREALVSHPHQTRQLLDVAHVPVNASDPGATVEGLVQLLWYNVFAVEDAVEKLGGQPFDNKRRWYSGSDNDWLLNHPRRGVERFKADRAALREIETHYQTSGDLDAPLVTLHTTGDAIVPYWHEPLYRHKVWRNRDWWLHTNIPILRYGHCSFKAEEVLFAFAVLRFKVEGFSFLNAGDVLTADQYDNYQRMMESYEMAPALDEAGDSR
jgi:hypothetical protein